MRSTLGCSHTRARISPVQWHLGINSDHQDRRYTPIAHGYESYLGVPWTNAPFCAMDSDGYSRKVAKGPTFCFLLANDTVVEMPLAIENFTSTITRHAVDFIGRQSAAAPFFFFMSYFHVHTPLFTNRTNRGRSAGGEFGDNVEECDDSVGEVLRALERANHSHNTLVLLTSDNGPYQEEGWAKAGRTNVWAPDGTLRGRLKGGKGQVYEGGVRMPGLAVWPGVVPPGSVSSTLVSTFDIFPTVLEAAGISLHSVLPKDYVLDGRSFVPVLRSPDAPTAHDVRAHPPPRHASSRRGASRSLLPALERLSMRGRVACPGDAALLRLPAPRRARRRTVQAVLGHAEMVP
jgi:arylsulfatase A